MADIVGPVLGAVVRAGAVLLSQYFSGKREERLRSKSIDADKSLKQMDFDRLKLGSGGFTEVEQSRQSTVVSGSVLTRVALSLA
jgi:hypothetical protein